jgi:hypothetical protein
LIGRDTLLFKIVTSPKFIRVFTKYNGALIVSCYDGVYEFDGENFIKSALREKKIKNSHKSNSEWNRLVDPTLNEAIVEQSADGVYWVLIKNRFFYGFKVSDIMRKSFPEHAVRGIFADGTTQLVSTYRGFFLNSERIFPDLLFYSNSNIIEENGYFYFAANNEMIYKMKKDGSDLEKIIDREKLNSINNAAVLRFYKGDLYIGGEKGLAKYHRRKGIEILQEGLEVNNLNVINGKLWVAADNGVYEWENNQLEKIFPVFNSTGVFIAGNKLVSTSSKGLWLYDRKKDKLENLLASSKYEHLETVSFYRDPYGNYWMSTADGILKYNLEEKKIYSHCNGVEFNRRAYYFNGDTLHYGSNHDGLLSFNLKNLIGSDITPGVRNTETSFAFIGVITLFITLLLLYFIFFQKSYIKELKAGSGEEMVLKKFKFLEIAQYIKDNIEYLNVSQLIEKSGMTRYAFYHAFEQEFGKKPKEYLTEVKTAFLKEKHGKRS